MDNDTTAKRTCKLDNKLGLHARPASLLAKKANEFEAEITLSISGRNDEVNAKSIMEIMMLAAERGSVLHVTANGEDAQEALNAIEELLSTNFGEK